jgi:hypothetical protein
MHWDEKIQAELNDHHAVVLALSPEYFVSDYCKKEMDIAMQGSKAFPVLLDDVKNPSAPVWALNVVPKDDSGALCSVRAAISGGKDAIAVWAHVYGELKQAFIELIESMNRVPDEGTGRIPFGAIKEQMRTKLQNACSFSLLTRTGQGWWRDFEDEFEKILKLYPGDSRVLLLNPDCDAFSVSTASWQPFRDRPQEKWSEYRDNAKQHIAKLSKKRLQLRMLDAYVPYSMFVVKQNPDPNNNFETVIFVELPKFTFEYQSGDILVINSAERKLHAEFLAAFNTLWDRYGSPRNSR